MIYRHSFLIVALMTFIGCTSSSLPAPAESALEQGTPFELLSLDPDDIRRESEPDDSFHNWTVLGRTQIEDADVRRRVVAAFQKGVKENPGMVSPCFIPRHGIRVTHQGQTVDFVICFECLSVQVFIDDERQEGILITDSPQPVFDQVLQDAGIPLAAKSEK